MYAALWLAQAQEEAEEAAAAAPKRGGLLGTQLLGRKEGLATIAERRYAQQQGSRGTGTQNRGGSQSTGTQACDCWEKMGEPGGWARPSSRVGQWQPHVLVQGQSCSCCQAGFSFASQNLWPQCPQQAEPH